MALVKETVIDKIEIDQFGSVQVRRVTRVLEDGTPIGGVSYHREAYAPGSDAALANDSRVSAVASAVWTPDVVTAYKVASAVSAGK